MPDRMNQLVEGLMNKLGIDESSAVLLATKVIPSMQQAEAERATETSASEQRQQHSAANPSPAFSSRQQAMQQSTAQRQAPINLARQAVALGSKLNMAPQIAAQLLHKMMPQAAPVTPPTDVTYSRSGTAGSPAEAKAWADEDLALSKASVAQSSGYEPRAPGFSLVGPSFSGFAGRR